MGFQLLDLFKPSTWQTFFSTYVTSDIIIHLIDILVVWFVIYKLIMMLNGTKAIQVFKGIAVIIIVRIVSDIIGLTTVSWLMNQVITYGVIAAIVIFQPEVRRGLEHLGRGSLLKSTRKKPADKDSLITALDEAIQYMSKRRIGALISIQMDTELDEFIGTGIPLDADISSELLINIFTGPVIHDENLKGYKRNYCKIGVVILAGGVVCAVFLNLGNTKLGNAVFMGIISAEFLYGMDLLINRKKDKAV